MQLVFRVETQNPDSPVADHKDSKGRQRRHHNRSRNGCAACKEGHSRCDELKPTWYSCARSCVRSASANTPRSSSRCKATKKPCRYPQQTLSRSEKRWCQGILASPGVHVWRMQGSKMDSFDSLPVKMPYNSQELLHYCEKNLLRARTSKSDHGASSLIGSVET
jgi:hypothetical protein